MKNRLYPLCLAISLVWTSQLGWAQRGMKIDMPVNNRVILNNGQRVVYAQLLHSGEKVKSSDELFYYWYGANDIKKTRGGYDGKLLHGWYTEYYYPTKNLKEKGLFQYGLKKGLWKSWYANGEYHELVNWKNGQRAGRFQEFDEEGFPVKTGFYKRDKLHGRLRIYHAEDSVEVVKFREGQPVIKKKQGRKGTNPSPETPKRKKRFGWFGLRKKQPSPPTDTLQLNQVGNPLPNSEPARVRSGRKRKGADSSENSINDLSPGTEGGGMLEKSEAGKSQKSRRKSPKKS